MNRPRSAATCPASFASRFALVFLAALMGFSSVSLFAQSANTFYKRGEAAEAREDYDAAYENYQQAATKSPSDLRYREALIRVRTSASGLHLTKGRKLVVTGDLQGAMAEYLRAAEIDPGNEAAQQEIARLRALQGQAAPAPAGTSPEMATRQEEIESMGAPVIPCGCSQRTGTVRRSLRDLLAGLEAEHPHLRESLLSAMGNVETSRLLDPRFLDLDGESTAVNPLVILQD